MLSLRRCGVALLCAVIFVSVAAAQQCLGNGKTSVAMGDEVPPTDGLAAHRLSFDASFACGALQSVRSKDGIANDRMGELPAITHLLNHARNFDYDVPKESGQALVRALLGKDPNNAERSAICEQTLPYFRRMAADPRWVSDALAYLPGEFRFNGSLFLTFGYDIGVAYGPNASLNCTHPHFKDQPRELLYYAIHELHHVGFMAYWLPPKVANIKTCAELLSLVEYSTQMEGMAVLAAYQRRRDDGVLADDADYVALRDAQRMQAAVTSYFNDYKYLRDRGTEAADEAAWAVIKRMSSGERLWYRVGAHMAQRIEACHGRAALAELIKAGPAQFLATYKSLE